MSPAHQLIDALGVQRLFWLLVESYPGRVEIDNVARFNKHLQAEFARLSTMMPIPAATPLPTKVDDGDDFFLISSEKEPV